MDSRLINAMVSEYGLDTIAQNDKARIGIKASENVEYDRYLQYRYRVLQSLDKDKQSALSAAMAELSAHYQKEIGNGNFSEVGYSAQLADKYLSQYNIKGLVGGPDEVSECEFKEVVAAFATTERCLFR